MNSEKTSPLFIWQGSEFLRSCKYTSAEVFCDLSSPYSRAESTCPFCMGSYSDIAKDKWGDHFDQEMSCRICGFWYQLHEKLDPYGVQSDWKLSYALLRQLDVTSAEMPLAELRDHLSSNFRDMYSLPPRIFEKLIGEVFGGLGYDVQLTQETRDGGYDLVLLERSRGDQILVECKRYSRSRNVGISVVQRVLGVQVTVGVRDAKIVATTGFSEPAVQAAAQSRKSGYKLELIDADRLLEMMSVNNPSISPLSKDERFT